jgi:hypothetical protein
VIGADPPSGRLERGALLARQPVERGAHRLGRDLERGHRSRLHAIEFRRVLEQRRVAPHADVGDDRRDGRVDARVLRRLERDQRA